MTRRCDFFVVLNGKASNSSSKAFSLKFYRLPTKKKKKTKKNKQKKKQKKKKRRGVVRFDLKGLNTAENLTIFAVVFVGNGKNLREKLGGSSLAAVLHDVPCFFSKFLPCLPFSDKRRRDGVLVCF